MEARRSTGCNTCPIWRDVRNLILEDLGKINKGQKRQRRIVNGKETSRLIHSAQAIGGVTWQAEDGIPRNPGAGTCQSKVFVIMSSLMTPCWESRQVERMRLVSDAA